MKTLILSTLLLVTSSQLFANESKVCQKCHPLIYKEYYNSIHRKASLPNDQIYAAVFKKEHQSGDKNNCKNCHSPNAKNPKELQEEPISCIYCHTIKDIHEGKVANKNIVTGKKRDFFSAEKSKKNQAKVKYETTSSFFGLIKTSKNSPYHTIEYNNENYYNGNVCMGCHSHTNNKHGVDMIMLDAYIDKKDKETCISCHMPKVMGSKTTLSDSKTHSFHGILGLHNMDNSLGKYIDLSVAKNSNGFEVEIKNQANHALFGEAYKEGVLQVSIIRGKQTIELKPYIFSRVFGKNGVKSTPFDATEVLKDTLIYAKKNIKYNTKLQKGDRVILTLGYRLITPKMAKELGIQDKKLSDLKVLKTQSFEF